MNNIVDLKIAKKLKLFAFNIPVAHAFVFTNPKYELQLFPFYIGTRCSVLNDVFQNVKDINQFEPNFIENESQVYFDYNQDIRKLVARIECGKEYMNDPKSYNMNIDSYTYKYWSEEQVEEMKIKLPNYNDGDFVWTVYDDIISAPYITDVVEWLIKKYNIFIHTEYSETDESFGYNIHILNTEIKPYKFFVSGFKNSNKAYLEAITHTLTKLI